MQMIIIYAHVAYTLPPLPTHSELHEICHQTTHSASVLYSCPSLCLGNEQEQMLEEEYKIMHV